MGRQYALRDGSIATHLTLPALLLFLKICLGIIENVTSKAATLALWGTSGAQHGTRSFSKRILWKRRAPTERE